MWDFAIKNISWRAWNNQPVSRITTKIKGLFSTFLLNAENSLDVAESPQHYTKNEVFHYGFLQQMEKFIFCAVRNISIGWGLNPFPHTESKASCSSKMHGKQLWKSDSLRRDADHWPESLMKISIFRWYFSHIFLVHANKLLCPKAECWLQIG